MDFGNSLPSHSAFLEPAVHRSFASTRYSGELSTLRESHDGSFHSAGNRNGNSSSPPRHNGDYRRSEEEYTRRVLESIIPQRTASPSPPPPPPPPTFQQQQIDNDSFYFATSTLVATGSTMQNTRQQQHQQQNTNRSVSFDEQPIQSSKAPMATAVNISANDFLSKSSNSNSHSNNRAESESKGNAARSARKGPFPFLRKNSRIEPSALNAATAKQNSRSTGSITSTAAATATASTSSSNSSSGGGSNGYRGNSSQQQQLDVDIVIKLPSSSTKAVESKQRSVAARNNNRSVQSSTIAPSSKEIVDLQASKPQQQHEVQAMSNNNSSRLNHNVSTAASAVAASFSMLDQSTVSINQNGWRSQRDDVQKELEEFELIEKQLTSETTNSSGSALKGSSSALKSSTLSHQHATIDVAAVETIATVDEEIDDDWDAEDYEYDSRYNSDAKHQQQQEQELTQTLKAVALHAQQNHHDDDDDDDDVLVDYQDDDDDNAGGEVAGDLYDEYDPNAVAAIKPASSNMMCNDSGGYLNNFLSNDSRDLQQQQLQQQQQKQLQQPQQLQQQQQQRVVAESQSWGRVTRLQSDTEADETSGFDDYDNDGNYIGPDYNSQDAQYQHQQQQQQQQQQWKLKEPQQFPSPLNPHMGSSVTTGGSFRNQNAEQQPMAKARMSNSALKKITSRNAALQQQPPQLQQQQQQPQQQQQRGRSHSAPRGGRVSRAASSEFSSANDDVGDSSGNFAASEAQRLLLDKGRQLEEEIEQYKAENNSLKKMRKQQETALSDAMSQREEAMRWSEEQRRQTAAWCEVQKQAAAKERRAAAKIARDSRLRAGDSSSGAVPIRKEKAEIEALHATIEKLKIEYETATKKSKMNEKRLYSLIKDHTQHIDDIQQQLLTIEQEKLLLLEFIGESGQRLPKHLRVMLQKTPSELSKSPGSGNSRSTIARFGPPQHQQQQQSLAGNVLTGRSANAGKFMGEQSYGEEVDVEEIGTAASRSHNFSESSISAPRHTFSHPENRKSSSSRSRVEDIATAVVGASSLAASDDLETYHRRHHSSNSSSYNGSDVGGVSSATDEASAFDYARRMLVEETNQAPGAVFNHLSSTLKSGSSGGRGRSSISGNTSNVKDSIGSNFSGQSNNSSNNSSNSNFNPRLSQKGSGRYNNFVNSSDEDENDVANDSNSSHRRSTQDVGNHGIAHFSAAFNQSTTTTLPTAAANATTAATVVGHRQQQQQQTFSSDRIGSSSDSNGFSSSAKLSHSQLTGGVAPSSSSSGAAAATAAYTPSSSSDTATATTAGGGSSNREETLLPGGRKLVKYRNGTEKEIEADGSSLVRFTNGDTKHSAPATGVTTYFYAAADTTHTTYADGSEVYLFPNKQVEKHHPNGVKEIAFPDGTTKIITPDGLQESHFPDGVVLREHPDGRREVLSSPATAATVTAVDEADSYYS